MARLVQEKRLDLDTPVQQYVPTFPQKGAAITPRLLAGHRAGIRPFRNDMASISHTEYPSVLESLAHFRHDPLVDVPGTGGAHSAAKTMSDRGAKLTALYAGM